MRPLLPLLVPVFLLVSLPVSLAAGTMAKHAPRPQIHTHALATRYAREQASVQIPGQASSGSTQTQTPPVAAAAPANAGSAALPPGVGINAPQAGSNVPAMAPTNLRPGEPTNAFPPLPGPLPAAVSNRGLATPTQAGAARTPTQKTSAQNTGPLNSMPLGVVAGPGELRVSGLGSSSAPWTIVLLLTALTLIPSLLICVTPFARLLVVFHFLRQALGLQTTPSNQTLIGLTMILTFFIMEPVGKQIYTRSFEPLQRGEITAFEAIARGQDPLRDFMVHFVREKDAALFLEIAKEPRPHDIHDLSMRVLLPAYIVSELKAGFQIGAVLFLPFLVVDMVVAAITTSVGMMQLPPVVISTPLKLLLFLMVNGWHLLISALMRSFQ